MELSTTFYPEEKEACYALLIEQLKALTEGESNPIPNLANASSLLFYALKHINWAGFYLLENNTLVLGPFQGKTACIRIPIGRGVCGTAVSQDKIQLIHDVHTFPGHIACDSASNSEIVVPIHQNGKIIGVLDIDSPILNRFDETDAKWLQQFVTVLEHNCHF